MLLHRFTLVAGLAAVLAAPSLASAQAGGPSPEELFQRLDKNNDGKLTADEIPDEQKRFFERTVRVGDKDSDGVLSKDEFVQANKPQDNPGVPLNPQGGSNPGDRLAEMRQRFEMMDRNKDGKVTKDEIPEQFRDRMAQLFDRAGKDSVTLEEFGRFSAGPPGGAGRPDVGQLFDRFDANKDGKITKDELPEPMRDRFAQAFERLGKTELTREDFAMASRQAFGQPGPDGRPMDGPMGGRPPAFLRLADTNDDGKLSKEELAKLADKFSELDRNNDGTLDLAELMGGPPGGGFGGGRPDMPRPDGVPGNRPMVGGPANNPFFTRMDANGDGKISKDEAPERMKENFARMDRNNDGFLTQDELQTAFDGQNRRPGQPGQPGQPRRPEGEGNRPRRPQSE